MKLKRILIALLSAIIFAGSFLYYPNMALANLSSPWSNRKQAHDQWFTITIQVGNSWIIEDKNWRPTFDYENVLGSGYTADHRNNINESFKYYLNTAELYDKKSEMYILSKAGADELRIGNNFVKGSEWKKEIPILKTPSEVVIKEKIGINVSKTTGASKSDPKVLYNNPPSSVVWDGENFYYALSTSYIDGEKRGICKLQTTNGSGADRAFVNPAQNASVGYGFLTLKFPYDTRFTDAAPTIISGNLKANQKAVGFINVVNLAPWTTVANYTKFRVYTWAEGDREPKLHGTPQSLKLTSMQPQKVNFDFVVPEKPFRLILTVNMHYVGGWQNEDLKTAFSEGGANHNSLEDEYLLNKVETSYGTPPSSPPPDNRPQANLAIEELQLYKDDKPVGGNIANGQSYKLKAKYTSTFEKGGFATIRYYIKRQAGHYDFKKQENIYFEPKATYTHDWHFDAVYSENISLVSTISYRWWEQQNKWDEELFNGTDRETTYTDNTKEVPVNGVDTPREPPQTIGYGFSLYYPTLVGGYQEIVEEIKHEKTIVGWYELDFVPYDVKGKVKAVIIE